MVRKIERQIDEAERCHRQHEMACDVGGAVKPGLARRDRFDAGQRQPAQLHRKHHRQHQPEPEAWNGIKRQRADRQQAIAQAARPRPGDDAERRAEAERQCGGAAHQQQGVRQPLADHVEDRPRERDGPAEVEMGERPEVDWQAASWPSDRAPSAGAIARSGRSRRRSTRYRHRRHRRPPPRAGRRFRSTTSSSTGTAPIRRRRSRISARRTGGLAGSERRARTLATAYLRSQPRWLSSCAHIRLSRHPSIHTSAQLETAQRGLFATFLTDLRATVMKPHSATLISGRSAATSFWKSL